MSSIGNRLRKGYNNGRKSSPAWPAPPSPWDRYTARPKTTTKAVLLLSVLAVLLLLLGLAWLAFLIWALVTNIIDITEVGANFWNVTWVVLSSIGILGSLGGTRVRVNRG